MLSNLGKWFELRHNTEMEPTRPAACVRMSPRRAAHSERCGEEEAAYPVNDDDRDEDTRRARSRGQGSVGETSRKLMAPATADTPNHLTRRQP